MRWNVQGTDAATGRDVLLAIDEPEATDAIKAAMDRRIIVSGVTADSRRVLRRALLPAACAAVVVLGAVCTALYFSSSAARGDLETALQQQARLADSLTQAEGTLAEMRRTGNLAAGPATQARQLAAQLAAARTRLSTSEQQLSMARHEVDTLQSAAQQIPELLAKITHLQQQLANANTQIARLNPQIAAPREPAGGADAALVQKAAALEKANQELTAQIDMLKNELLVAAAATTTQSPAPESTVAEGSPRWSLRAGYGGAADFLRLNFDRDSLTTTATSDGAVASSGALAANAATLRFLHDRQRERVYSATLCVSLATDAPPEKLAENMKLVGLFVRAFAPGLKDSEMAIGPAVRELAGKDDHQRVVLTGDDGRLTIWNNRLGMYTFRIEPPRAGQD